MSNVADVTDWLIFLWLLLWALKASRSILRSEKDSANFLILTHFAFCGVPAVLDLAVARPLYITFPVFEKLQDSSTDVVYAAYVCACPVLWWYFGKQKRRPFLRSQDSTSLILKARKKLRRLGFALWLIALAPLVVFLGAPDKSFYSTYGAVIRSSMTDEMTSFHGVLSATTVGSVFAIAALISISRRPWRTLVVCLPLTGISIWLNGKRSIVLVALVVLVVSLWERKALTGRSLIATASLGLLGFGYFSYSYQLSVRSEGALSSLKQYQDFRIDYGRDHGIKYAIYCELHPEEPSILEYRGESILFDLVAYVPRAFWPEKPWPYAVYATAADLGIRADSIGWGITTSWLEESIANLGWTGLIVGPIVLALVCRAGDARGSQGVRFLTVIVACLMLTVQLSAFSLLALAWLVSIVRGNKNRTATNSKLNLIASHAPA